MRRIGSEAARWRRRVAVGVVAVALVGAAACGGDDDDEKGDKGDSEEETTVETTDQLDLVMSSPGLEQRLSLLTGQPGPDNVAVLARASRAMAAPIAGQDVSFTRTEFGMSDSTTEKVGIFAASLQWAAGMGDDRKAGAGRAFLHVALDGAVPNLARATELRLADGTIVQPLAPVDENDMLASISPEVVFDVPADITEGTIILGKDYSWDVPTGGTMSARFDNKAEYPLTIPAAT